jgi:hypothetical protein
VWLSLFDGGFGNGPIISCLLGVKMISIRLFLNKKKITWLKMTIKLSFGFWCVKGVLISIKFNDFLGFLLSLLLLDE